MAEGGALRGKLLSSLYSDKSLFMALCPDGQSKSQAGSEAGKVGRLAEVQSG